MSAESAAETNRLPHHVVGFEVDEGLSVLSSVHMIHNVLYIEGMFPDELLARAEAAGSALLARPQLAPHFKACNEATACAVAELAAQGIIAQSDIPEKVAARVTSARAAAAAMSAAAATAKAAAAPSRLANDGQLAPADSKSSSDFIAARVQAELRARGVPGGSPVAAPTAPVVADSSRAKRRGLTVDVPQRPSAGAGDGAGSAGISPAAGDAHLDDIVVGETGLPWLAVDHARQNQPRSETAAGLRASPSSFMSKVRALVAQSPSSTRKSAKKATRSGRVTPFRSLSQQSSARNSPIHSPSAMMGSARRTLFQDGLSTLALHPSTSTPNLRFPGSASSATDGGEAVLSASISDAEIDAELADMEQQFLLLPTPML
ncbi:uncharacterized protein AMSG_10855 [Thecamonas trahens ATCC 50062]|uniref:Uncharacterized protein n=1 Tax=Thecamonas trahens ATCC 50062 TaxID=461836 RepID=A0A0L0DT61_THETB|nr:hypothetical protein AMSG_10855 [Thecamonas trahens ATCC 50062]KNC55226.1 hypothetical protein AMSG_10855 [Thecamonas trahens ATCC 50062]|eukprot:XP_013753156.1 hypothetical protein AMSG_10855 [Thecamonas trahens ATCC 50062]